MRTLFVLVLLVFALIIGSSSENTTESECSFNSWLQGEIYSMNRKPLTLQKKPLPCSFHSLLGQWTGRDFAGAFGQRNQLERLEVNEKCKG